MAGKLILRWKGDPCNIADCTRKNCATHAKAPTLRCKVKPTAVAQPHGLHEPIWTGGNAARLECIEDIRKVFRFDTEDRLIEQRAWHNVRQVQQGNAPTYSRPAPRWY